MNLFWTLFLCALGFQSTVQIFPTTVIPLNYKLWLYVVLGDMFNGGSFYFAGGVWITIKCLQQTNTITLDSKNLLVSNVRHDSTITGTIQFDQNGDLLTLHLPHYLEKDKVYLIIIDYRANFENVLQEGFLLTSLKNPSTCEPFYQAIAYLQNGNARKVFPCFDEPGIKTTFEINIAHNKRNIAESNMPKDHTGPGEGNDYIWTYFSKTNLLSTGQVFISVYRPGYWNSLNSLAPTIKPINNCGGATTEVPRKLDQGLGEKRAPLTRAQIRLWCITRDSRELPEGHILPDEMMCERVKPSRYQCRFRVRAHRARARGSKRCRGSKRPQKKMYYKNLNIHL